MFRRLTLLAATALGSIAAAALGSSGVHAQPVTGPYVSLGGGGNLVQDETLRLNPAFPAGKLRFDTGGAAGVGAVGYGFGNGLRLELEGDWRYNGLRQFLGTPFPTRSGGEQQNYGGMINAMFDMDIGSPYVYPYVGIGGGYTWTRWDHIQTIGANTPYAFTADGTNGGFAYQGIFGLSFPVSFVRGLSLTAEYRFFAVAENEQFNGQSIGTHGPFGPKPLSVARGNADITSDYNHTALLGLRYALFQPAPPPPPAPPAPASAPAPEAARTYLVFFDWDRADLTSRARHDCLRSCNRVHARPNHTHRGQRLHRPLRHGRLQREAVGSPRQERGIRTRPRRREPQRDQHPRLRREQPAGADRQGRPRAAEPPGGDHPALAASGTKKGGILSLLRRIRSRPF